MGLWEMMIVGGFPNRFFDWLKLVNGGSTNSGSKGTAEELTLR